jgi:WD repeat-containing protein 23
VNAVCFADDSHNVLISGSDDTFLKVWDRRSLRSHSRPSGVFIGHTEGVTYVSSKGDGRYCLSNGKDQKMKMWDLRSMRDLNDCRKDMR